MAEYVTTQTGQPPFEYIKYRLRAMYHCTPKELAENEGQYFLEMMHDLECERWEHKAAKLRKSLG